MPPAVGERSFLCLSCRQAVITPAQPLEPIVCQKCGRTYAVDDGIVLLDDRRVSDDTAQPEDYSILIETEPRHFWFAARNALIQATLEETLGPLAGRSVLDVGCGTGFVLGALDRAGMSTCAIDVLLECLRYARHRTRGTVLRGSGFDLPFEAQFDAALLCDVIEHLDDDIGALREARRALRPGGVLLVTVPAHAWLWSALDDVSGHKRRYNRRGLRRTLAEAGLDVKVVRYFNSLLMPLQFLQRLLIRGRQVATQTDREHIIRASMRIPPQPLNAAFDLLTRADVPLGRMGVPFGSSLVATAVRR